MDTPRNPDDPRAQPERPDEKDAPPQSALGGVPGGDAALQGPPGGLPGQGPPGPERGPQSPLGDPGPQGPAGPPPGWAPPAGPQAPAVPPGGWSAPPGAGYGGPVPPGGWQQPFQPAGYVPPAQLASWGSRAAAYIIDWLIIGIPTLIVLGILGIGLFASGDNDAGVVAFVVGLIVTALVAFLISLVYAPILMMRPGERNGQTWGKQLLSIRAIRTNGQPFSFGYAALREVVLKNLAVNIASSIIPLVPWLLNFLWPLWDDQNQALHDIAVSTRVVRA